MKFRKPELIPLLFIIAAVGLLAFLGAWQIERLQWKNALSAAIEKAQSQPVLNGLPRALEGLEYRAVKLTGTFQNERALHMVGGKQNMGPGFFIMTPLTLTDGRNVLINRGFAPLGKESRPKGIQTVEGVIRPPRAKRLFSPENYSEKNVWFYEDMMAMSQAARLALLPIVVEATGTAQKDAYPIPSDGKISLRNDHLGYAITWFSLAIIALIMFALYHRKK